MSQTEISPLIRVSRQFIEDMAPEVFHSSNDLDLAMNLITRLIKKSMPTFTGSPELINDDPNDLKNQAAQINPKLANVFDKLNAILNITNRPIKDNKNRKSQTSGRQPARVWREYEDRRLLAGIHRYGLNDWHQVSAFVGSGRNAVQCSQRWFRSLDPDISRDAWTPEEDTLLIELVAKLGDKSWKLIAEQMPRRSDVQCRYRYRRIDEKVIFDTLNQGRSQTVNVSQVIENQNIESQAIQQQVNNTENFTITNEKKESNNSSKDLFDIMAENNFFAFGDTSNFSSDPFLFDPNDVIFNDCFSF